MAVLLEREHYDLKIDEQEADGYQPRAAVVEQVKAILPDSSFHCYNLKVGCDEEKEAEELKLILGDILKC